jgi:hypothetical protein
MKLRQMAIFVSIVLTAGCASSAPPLTGFAGSAESGTKTQDPELHDPLVKDCKFQCTVSPGAGCC